MTYLDLDDEQGENEGECEDEVDRPSSTIPTYSDLDGPEPTTRTQLIHNPHFISFLSIFWNLAFTPPLVLIL